jgi:hypothetical protein
MSNIWDADIEISAECAQKVIAMQFPELAPII